MDLLLHRELSDASVLFIPNAKKGSNSENLNDIYLLPLFMDHPVVNERMFATGNKIRASQCKKVSRSA